MFSQKNSTLLTKDWDVRRRCIFNSGFKRVTRSSCGNDRYSQCQLLEGVGVVEYLNMQHAATARDGGILESSWALRYWGEEKKVVFLYSHHGNIHRHHRDVLKLRAVTVQLQVSALAELRNDSQHWRGGGEREGRSEGTSITGSLCTGPQCSDCSCLEEWRPGPAGMKGWMKAEFIKSDLEDKDRLAVAGNTTGGVHCEASST